MTVGYSAEHYEKYDPNFKEDLRRSQDYVWIAAQWLWGKGRYVVIPPVRVRPKVDEMGDYSDCGDLFVADGMPGTATIKRIEIKHRPTMHFTSKEDFRYPTVIVDVAHCWDDADPKPEGYIIFNDDASCCLIVKGSSSGSWKKQEKFDRAKNRQRSFYECPVSLCSFYKVG